MNNELYRKLTSITLMTIMFAGGMTIAIPGELPTAVAQTGTLSVSASAAGVFGGAQVIEIVIDDPDLDELPATATEIITKPDVEVDDTEVTMRQATTGKWYAYVANNATFAASPLSGALQDDTTNVYAIDTDFLSGAPTPAGDNPPAWTVQTFDFDGDVEITANRGDESITLDYDDHSDIATISVDRNDVPAEGQVHITISDFQLNLDPTADDAWTLNADGMFGYNNVLNNTDDDPETPETPVAIAFDGSNGVFGISGSNDDMAVFENGINAVVIDETGSNTGVFESSNSEDDSEISVHEDANDGHTFTIAYADDDQQVIVDSFDSTLELVADGTWNSGDTLTVRLTNENLNINTLDDDDMEIDDPALPVMTFGAPTTVNAFGLESDNPRDRITETGTDTGTVKLTASTD